MKFCIGCIHLQYTPATESYHYSEATWEDGSPPELACKKRHWEHRLAPEFTQEKFQQAMESAETCPDYTEREDPLLL